MHRASVSSSGLIDAKLEEHQICMQCPSCGHKIGRKPDWVGLPAGVKFDPTDQELIEHLEAKVRSCEDSKSHPLIDEFIPTIEGEDGICYTLPEKLPGVTRDGLSKHFFHRPSKAYTTGTRKRRKIQTERDLQKGETRWHKTGKTRPVLVNGRQKGCKKILVLYTNFGRHRKPEKTNWVMHQYHLGELEEEKEGELVVSKVFYQTQPRQCSWSDRTVVGSAAEGLDHRRWDTGTSSSSKEVGGQLRDEQLSSGPAGISTALNNFRKSFDEVGMGETPTMLAREGAARTCEESEEHEQHQTPSEHELRHVAATAAFHVSRPTNTISTILSPDLLHQTAMPLDDPYHVSSILFQSQQQQHQKLVGSSGAGLEEVIMGCTSAAKGETSIPQSQEAEWQYPYWLPGNQDHHG